MPDDGRPVDFMSDGLAADLFFGLGWRCGRLARSRSSVKDVPLQRSFDEICGRRERIVDVLSLGFPARPASLWENASTAQWLREALALSVADGSNAQLG